jgi:hypothetical protein
MSDLLHVTNTTWRYYPAESVGLPLSELPALPHPGAYRVQLFDVGQILIRDSEMRIIIPVEWIRRYCKIYGWWTFLNKIEVIR